MSTVNSLNEGSTISFGICTIVLTRLAKIMSNGTFRPTSTTPCTDIRCPVRAKIYV